MQPRLLQRSECKTVWVQHQQTGTQEQKEGVWEIRAKGVCFPFLPVHTKDNRVSCQSTLSQGWALLALCVCYFWFGLVFCPTCFTPETLHNFYSKFAFRAAAMLQRTGSARLSQLLMLAGHKEWMTLTEVPTAIVPKISIKMNARGITPTQGGLSHCPQQIRIRS